jgi:hypothetical protein
VTTITTTVTDTDSYSQATLVQDITTTTTHYATQDVISTDTVSSTVTETYDEVTVTVDTETDTTTSS